MKIIGPILLSAVAIVFTSAAAAMNDPAQPANSADRYQQGCTYGRGQMAVDACTSAISSGLWGGYDLAWAFTNRGIAYASLGQIASALADFNQAIALKPNDWAARLNRGFALGALGKFPDAIRDYDVAISVRPNDANAYNARFFARGQLGTRLDLAVADCDRALQLATAGPGLYRDSEVYNTRALVHFRQGKYAESIADDTKALDQNPKQASSYYIRGLAKLKIADATGGKADIESASNIEPNIEERYASFGVKP
jgi:tetratricopeptide (TPR) repeat protein